MHVDGFAPAPARTTCSKLVMFGRAGATHSGGSWREILFSSKGIFEIFLVFGAQSSLSEVNSGAIDFPALMGYY
jgi:hypothetical protein